MRPRTRTATSSEEPSPIHFDHSHPWNANDRRGQGLVLELVGFQVTFLRHLLADLLSDSTHLTATDCDLRQLAKHLGRQTKRGMRTTSDHDLPEDRWAEAMPVKSQRGTERRESGTDTILTRWGVLDYGSAMPRTARVAPGGMVFHVLNRGVARMQLFDKAAEYQAFEQVLQDTLDQSPMRICAYAVMPNHWHLLLWPECDGELAAFMQRLTITHVRRWQEHRGYAGLGHVYQGRYKSFPVESDEHFWVVARYVERNALRANLVLRAEEWRWSSLWQRCHPTGEERSLLAAWPIDMPANWLERVNQTDDAQELEALRRSVQRGRPFGQPEWQKEIAQRLGLESAYRPTGRPRKVDRNQMPRPGEDRSDVGGAAQFNNIGPVPLSPLSLTIGPVPLSRFRFP